MLAGAPQFPPKRLQQMDYCIATVRMSGGEDFLNSLSYMEIMVLYKADAKNLPHQTNN